MHLRVRPCMGRSARPSHLSCKPENPAGWAHPSSHRIVHGWTILRMARAWPQGTSLTISPSTLLGTGASSESNQRAQHGNTRRNPRGTMSSRQPRLWMKTLILNKHIYTHKSILINQRPSSYLLGPASTDTSLSHGLSWPWSRAILAILSMPGQQFMLLIGSL